MFLFTKYLILDSTPIPLETFLLNSCNYGFQFKLESKMSQIFNLSIRFHKIPLMSYSSFKYYLNFFLLEEECISWIYDNSRYASWRTEIYHRTTHAWNSQVWRTTCSGKVTVFCHVIRRLVTFYFDTSFSFQQDLSFIYFFLCRVCLLRRSFTRIHTTKSQ